MLLGLLISSFAATGADMSNGADNFYQSNKVTQQKVCRILRDVANFPPWQSPFRACSHSLSIIASPPQTR